MSIYHCSIKIINRAGGRSAIASAAYRSGEKLHNEETGLTHDFTRKNGVIMNEILLPVNAPIRFQNREILWNEVQRVEKRSDAQFAREVEAALPVEMTRANQIECVRNFIKENFVNEGMIADWALHDKGDGNPHAHIMLTVRGIDSDSNWMPKQKSVFANARDSDGRAIYNPDLPVYDSKNKGATKQYRIPVLDKNGNQKTRVRKGKGTEYLWEKISIPVNDWNEHSQAEKWRESWAKHCNKYLSEDNQIDHRSYERQGSPMQATIHEGVTARKMERNGKIADRCEINRGIKKRNSITQQLINVAKELTYLITKKASEIFERFRKTEARLRNNSKHDKGTELDFGYNRGITESAGGKAGRSIRIDELKRFVADTSEAIEKADRTIQELCELILKKEAEKNERIRRIRERQQLSRNGRGNADKSGEAGAGNIRTENQTIGNFDGEFGTEREELFARSTDIEQFLNNLETQEKAAGEKRINSEIARGIRDTQQQRQEANREQAAKERSQGIKPKSR